MVSQHPPMPCYNDRCDGCGKQYWQQVIETESDEHGWKYACERSEFMTQLCEFKAKKQHCTKRFKCPGYHSELEHETVKRYKKKLALNYTDYDDEDIEQEWIDHPLRSGIPESILKKNIKERPEGKNKE